MKSACRVADEHVRISALCRIAAVKYNRRRVGALRQPYNRHIVALRPYFKLIRRCRAKCVRRCKNNFFALVFQLVGNFSDCCCFPDAVYADYKYNRRFCFKMQRTVRA